MDNGLFDNPEPILATLAQIYASEGLAREVALVANANATMQHLEYDNWNGGTDSYRLFVEVPSWLYTQLNKDKAALEADILERTQIILAPSGNSWLQSVFIKPRLNPESGWREQALAWVAGEGVSNQGRVRSDNIASRTADGLLFRSEPEIFLYKALKNSSVSFAPLPVFVRGGAKYKRIEPDFVIIKDGIVMIVEVDGDTVHHETPAEAHDRTTMLVHEGVHVERVKANECNTSEKAGICATKLIHVIEKLRSLR